MGGGHVSRPDFGMPLPDAAYPLTEFYLLAQQALEKSGSFMLPALYAGLQAPARRIYREEAAGYLQLAAAPAEGLTRLLSPARMQLLYSSLQVQPDGTPAALLLTEECTRLTVAVQLLPPFVWEDPLPPLPDVPAATANAGCTTPRPRPFSPSGWRCCKGSINKEGAPSPLLLSAIPWYTDR